MPKITFAPDVLVDLTNRLQHLFLEALDVNGQWDAESIRFQGGTCLNLVYGSPRFSEDLDFVVGTQRGIMRAMNQAQQRFAARLDAVLPGANCRMASRDEDPDSPEAKNPRTFMLTVEHPQWYRSVKVKVEFWVADADAVAAYSSGLRTAQVLSAVTAGPLQVKLKPVDLQAADPQEILVDKVHAIAMRPYLKYRDAFDLWWLRNDKKLSDWPQLIRERYPHHMAMYSDSPAVERLGGLLQEKALELEKPERQRAFAEDMQRWLGPDHEFARGEFATLCLNEVASTLRDCGKSLAQLAPSVQPAPSRRPKP